MENEILSYLEATPSFDAEELRTRMNYVFGARCDPSCVKEEMEELGDKWERIRQFLDKLDNVLCEAEDFGYGWPGSGDYWSSTSRPEVGDDTWEEYLSPSIRKLASKYRSRATFMTRRGQRSQQVEHAEL